MKKNNFNEISSSFQEVQNKICNWLEKTTNEKYKENLWDYEKGEGGGCTSSKIVVVMLLKKGGVNFAAASQEN